MPEDLEMKNMDDVVDTGPPPCGIETLKGYKNGAFSSEFIKFISTNPFTTTLYKWMSHASNPDEHFMNTVGSLSFEKVEGSEEVWKIWQQLGNGVKFQNFTMINDNSWLVGNSIYIYNMKLLKP